LPGSASGNGFNGLAGEICATKPLPATAATAAPASPPATNTSAANLQPAAVNSVDCIDKAAFVADVTIPDNTLLKKNTGITKTWRIKNAGTCTWADGYQLTFTVFHLTNLPRYHRITLSLLGTPSL
jgi:Ig-like domain from next to BRCA1 gene